MLNSLLQIPKSIRCVEDLPDTGVRTALHIDQQAPLDNLISLIRRQANSTNAVYVTDEQDHLVGRVNVETLLQCLTPAGPSHLLCGMFMRDTLLFLDGQQVGNFTTHCPRVETSTPVKDVVRLMLTEHMSELPVVDGKNRLIGAVDAKAVLAVCRAQ